MRTVYLGTSDFAVDVLEAVATTPHRPVLVVTRPDRPKGRGQEMRQCAVHVVPSLASRIAFSA